MRGIKFWHILLLIIGGITLVSFFDGPQFKGAHIARIDISGLITRDTPRHQMLVELGQNENILAVLVHIDSPGGTANASEQIYKDLRQIAANKPVIALMGSVAASGGYIVALGADRIFAYPTTTTGSIGVVAQWFTIKGLINKLGIEAHSVRSGSLKAKPDPFDAPTIAEKKQFEEIIQETFDWFIDLVALRRNIKRAEVLKKVGNGAIFSGTRALKLNMVDEIGGEEEARQWLASQHQIAVEVPIENYEPDYPSENVRDWVFNSMLRAFGLTQNRQGALLDTPPQGVMLLWQF